LFVLLSAAEGFGMAIFEALALGIPYVATDLPPIREATHNGLGGVLIRESKMPEAAQHMIQMLTHQATDVDELARDRICREADWEPLSRRFESILTELVGGDSRI